MFNVEYVSGLIDWLVKVAETLKKALEAGGVTGIELAVAKGNISLMVSFQFLILGY